MDIRVTTHPTTTVVTATELTRLKTYLRIEDSTEDTDLKEYYVTGSQVFEKLTGRGVFTTARRLALPYPDELCVGDTTGWLIEIPYPNLIAVQSVKYYDDDDTEQTLSSTYYDVNTSGDVGRVTITSDGLDAMGEISTLITNPISINYTSGYGADTDSVPLGIRQWLRRYVKWEYNVPDRLSVDGIPNHLYHLALLWKLGKVW